MSQPPKTKIFVGRLPESCRADELRVLFEKYGTVNECDVLNRYAFVHMSTAEEAHEAIRNLNDVEFQGARISVEASTGKRTGRSGSGGGFTGGVRNGGGPMRYSSSSRSGGDRPSGRSGPYDRRPEPAPAPSRAPGSRTGYDYDAYYPRTGVPEATRPRSAYDLEEYYARVREYYDRYGRSAAVDAYGRSVPVAPSSARADDRRGDPRDYYATSTAAAYYPRSAVSGSVPSSSSYSRGYSGSSSAYPSAYSTAYAGGYSSPSGPGRSPPSSRY